MALDGENVTFHYNTWMIPMSRKPFLLGVDINDWYFT